jgi:Arc/MetJ-type ribon-helix-helix transcriptional regulator
VRTTQQLSITRSNEMAEVVEAKVRRGDYASESEIIGDGLRALFDGHRRSNRRGHRPVLRTRFNLPATREQARRCASRIEGVSHYRKRVNIGFEVDADLVSIVGVFDGSQVYESILQDETESWVHVTSARPHSRIRF